MFLVKIVNLCDIKIVKKLGGAVDYTHDKKFGL